MTSADPMEEAERRIMPSPARGTMVALGLIAASAAVVTAATATGWLSSGHVVASGPKAAAADPVVLLARITAAVGVVCVLATLGGRLARRVGQPPVAGEVVVGLILGPSVVATLLPGVYHYLLPTQVMTFVSVAAQAGLAIFMFTVGAEFDPGILRGQRGVIGSASLAMMALPFALGVVTAVPVLTAFHGPSGTSVPFALFIGTALGVTAFPVLARIVQDSGLRGTRLSVLALTCAAMADVLAWCALAVVLAMVHGQGPAGVLRTLGLTVAVGLVCVFVLRPLVRVVTDRFADAAVPDAIRLLAVGVLIIGLATVTDQIGVHAIFGGFLAGVVLPRGNPLLGSTVEQITKLNQALLVPVFFASIGMQADVRAALSHPAIVASGALLIVAAVVGKLASAAPVAWAGGMPGRSALGLGVLMNARGVTEIVVLSIGLSAGIINTAAFTVLVIVALLTTCMAVPALRLLGLDHASRPQAEGGDVVSQLAAEPEGQFGG